MKEKIGVYFCIEKNNEKYRLNYVIKEINQNKVFIKIKKNLKNDTAEKRVVEALEYLLSNIVALIKLNEIDVNSKIELFTNNRSARMLLDKKDNISQESIKFFLEKINLNKVVEYKNIGMLLKKEKQVSMKIYRECKKIVKEYYKVLKRNSTLEKLEESIKTTKTLVFFDFEMNCLVNFKSVEIVSVGACKINLETNEVSRFYSLIKPQEVSELTEKCIEITGLDQEEIDISKGFNEVLAEFGEWVNDKSAIFLFWGGNDIAVLKNDLKRNDSKSKDALMILQKNIDFQEVLCKDILNREDMLSLKNGLIEANLELEGLQHNAGDDAYNLFRIYKEFEKRLMHI
ncbi:MAG: exonuclease domain-containing protein [Clostridium sp.]|uniref:exonuclease domain-containing protein n=1 Tax=Clostridium sp. TaxID=1506 RepID=UPI003F2E84A6